MRKWIISIILLLLVTILMIMPLISNNAGTYGNTIKPNIRMLNMIDIVNSGCKTHSWDEEYPVSKTEQGYMFEKKCVNCGEIESVFYEALITFVDDDAKADALFHWERIMDATGIKVTSAVIPGKVTESTNYEGYWSYAGWDIIHRLKSKGMDFVNHTYNHINLTKLTKEEILEDLKKAKDVLSLNGIDSDILVYPNTAYNDTVLSIVPDFFRAAVTSGGILNKAPFDNRYTINRVNINDSSVTKDIDFGSKTVTCQGIRSLENLKKYATDAVNSEAWLIFMCHAYDSPGGRTYFDEEAEQIVIDFCTYVQNLGNVKIVTLTEGVNMSMH